MTTWLINLINTANGRHFEDDELVRLADYAERLPERLRAAQKIDEVRRRLSAPLRLALAEWPALAGADAEALADDLAAALKPLARAVMLDSPGVFVEPMHEALLGLTAALDVPPESAAEVCEMMRAVLAARLPANVAELALPLVGELETAFRHSPAGVGR